MEKEELETKQPSKREQDVREKEVKKNESELKIDMEKARQIFDEANGRLAMAIKKTRIFKHWIVLRNRSLFYVCSKKHLVSISFTLAILYTVQCTYSYRNLLSINIITNLSAHADAL